jgi:hypothetical protein
MFDQ